MHSIGRLLSALSLLACPLGAQALTAANGSIATPALGTRVSIEGVRASEKGPAVVVITVFRPVLPTTIRLAIPQVRLLMNLTDSVLALPAGPEKATYFPIYLSPANVGPTLTTYRSVTDQGDQMRIHVSTVSTSATVVLGRKAAEAFIAVLGDAMAQATSLKPARGSAQERP
jgi:hypothetical protein